MSKELRLFPFHQALSPWVVAAILLPVFLLSGRAPAGSVFMKNGYIIQGPITDRSQEAVVLGWPNGKVTIQRRFIESVAYDSGEEKRLQEEENHRAREGAAQEDDPLFLVSSSDADELPATLDEYRKRFGEKATQSEGASPGQDQASSPASLGASPGSTDPSSAGAGSIVVEGAGAQGQGTPSGTPGVVPRPQESLADRLTDSNLFISLRPPKGWVVKSSHGAFRVFGEPLADGFRPSMNVVSLPKGPLGVTEYLSVLKEEGARLLQNFEVLSEGPRTIGNEKGGLETGGPEKGYELSARGSYKGRSAVYRQVLVIKGDRVWLVSTFSQAEKGNEVFSLLDESVATVEFGAR